MVRVRFAPSPTGFLHVGGARTALFNWLFARRHKGTFILRIEDTDEARSTLDSVGQILESMAWLGLNWDEGPVMSLESGLASRESNEENKSSSTIQNSRLKTLESKGNFGPYFQMQRVGLYKKYAQELIAKGSLYECFCSEEELEKQRNLALLEKRAPRYPKSCRHLSVQQKETFRNGGKKSAWRFAMPEEGEILIADLIRGDVKFDCSELEDFIVIKSTGGPTYNFACVVDDHLMEISHVIRGEDHISNTPKQILLFKAFGWNLPQFAHLSMIMGPDGTRLSKRHGATSVIEFREQGYLPQALINYLALLGWGTQASQDLFEFDDMVAQFDIARCQKNPAGFDYGKLTWMNGVYIRKLSKDQLFTIIKKNLPPNEYPPEQLASIIALEQEKFRTLADAPRLLDFFFTEEYPHAWEDLDGLFAKSKGLKGRADCARLLDKVQARISSISDFSVASLEIALKETAKELGWKNAEVFHPLRFAISGRLQGPSLFHMAEVLGKERVLARIGRFQAVLKETPPSAATG